MSAVELLRELLATRLVAHWAAETGCENVVLSGGVTANVKMNQRIHEIDKELEQIELAIELERQMDA